MDSDSLPLAENDSLSSSSTLDVEKSARKKGRGLRSPTSGGEHNDGSGVSSGSEGVEPKQRTGAEALVGKRIHVPGHGGLEKNGTVQNRAKVVESRSRKMLTVLHFSLRSASSLPRFGP